MPRLNSLREPSQLGDTGADTDEAHHPDPGRAASLKRDTQKWTRWLHVYTSMIALLVVLFFGLTGITLNHPDWAFGNTTVRDSATGFLPDGSVSTDGSIDFLAVTEYVRAEYDVKGAVADYGSDVTDGYVSFKNPGYAADLFFDLDTGGYELNVEQSGFVAVMNDLHKGRDTTGSWNWLIDVSGGFLVLISATGLGLQLFLKKRRRAALVTAALGSLVLVLLVLVAIN